MEKIVELQSERNLADEGIRFDGQGPVSLQLLTRRNLSGDCWKYELVSAALPGDASSDNVHCDVIVIHEGVLDLIGGSVKWPSDENDLDKQEEIIRNLWKLAPMMIRTSGRGRPTKHFPRQLPFVEFSEISSSLLTARNKLALVRSLLGALGERK